MPREGIVPTVLARIRALATLLLYVVRLPPSPKICTTKASTGSFFFGYSWSLVSSFHTPKSLGDNWWQLSEVTYTVDWRWNPNKNIHMTPEQNHIWMNMFGLFWDVFGALQKVLWWIPGVSLGSRATTRRTACCQRNDFSARPLAAQRLSQSAAFLQRAWLSIPSRGVRTIEVFRLPPLQSTTRGKIH